MLLGLYRHRLKLFSRHHRRECFTSSELERFKLYQPVTGGTIVVGPNL